MRRLGLLAAMVAGAVFAGEGYLGTLTPVAVSNNNLGAGSDGGFAVPCNSKLTVQCNNADAGGAHSYDCMNLATCTALKGIYLTGNQALPTSTSNSPLGILDGGAKSCLVSAFSAENNNCTVFVRQGTE